MHSAEYDGKTLVELGAAGSSTVSEGRSLRV